MVSSFRISRLGDPITTAISVIPFRSATADRQNFAFAVDPVFNPFAP